MKLKYLALGIAVYACLTLVTGFTSSVVDSNTGCGDVEVNSQDIDVAVNETNVSLSGLYCANTGGYSVAEKSMNSTGDGIEALIEIAEPEENEMVTTAITPVEFDLRDQFSEGSYNFSYSLEIGNDTFEEGSEELDLIAEDDAVQTSSFSSLINWFTSLF